ncbi:alpha/beta fold hydrolase [Mesorhizobium sp. NBSH29]|uniref:alpha/beta fold hydrolase n=1 Tax=Mesorhizobium sp. NBSH29 TaxID=2654249 RepID=UPI0018967C33|nr:alpha/beta hydrolase [Mesorhizobium sp. NBSH29]QPC87264.1 alpha/beta fold hydrolase [Mesorhizobium sp. NBSH29]
MKTDDYSSFFYSAADGLKLHARIYGQANETVPVVCLPGLTRNARDFHELAVFLSNEPKTPRQVITFDYRGRGQSEFAQDWTSYNIMTEAEDVLAGLTAMGVEHGGFIGTSRGGLIIHLLAGMRPGLLRAVVLNDIGPVVEGEGLAHIRAYLERAPIPASMADAVAIQKATHGQAFSALSEDDWHRFVGALYRKGKNDVPVADFDPALLNTLKAVDLTRPLPDLWAQFAGLANIPLLAIRGENSKLLSAATLDEMRRRHPDCQALIVEGQGHAPLLETGNLPAKISSFLRHCER